MALNTELFTGAGDVALAIRRNNVLGPMLRMGNCTEASITSTIEQLEHRENQTGDNNIDFQCDIQKMAMINLTLEGYQVENLETCFYGQQSTINAGTVSAEPLTFRGAGSMAVLSRLGLTSFTGLTNQAGTRFYAATTEARTLQMTVSAASANLTMPGGVNDPHNLRSGNRVVINPAINGATNFFVVTTGQPGVIQLSDTFTGAALASAAFAGATGTLNVQVIPDFRVSLTRGTIDFLPGIVATNGATLLANFVAGASRRILGLSDTNLYGELLIAGMNRVENRQGVRIYIPNLKITPAQRMGILTNGNQFESYNLEFNILWDEARNTWYQVDTQLGLS